MQQSPAHKPLSQIARSPLTLTAHYLANSVAMLHHVAKTAGTDAECFETQLGCGAVPVQMVETYHDLVPRGSL